MPTVRVRDLNFYYESHGGGEPLLMIMGLGGSALGWEPALVADLARSFRSIVYDNRGTGRSDKPDEEYSIDGLAADAAALLGALGLERAHIFGVSMGGMIAQQFALHYPARVQTLTLGCTTAGGRNAMPATPEAMAILTAPRNGLSDAELIRRAWPINYTAAYLQSHRAELEAGIVRVLAHPTPAFAYKRQLAATFKFNTYDRLPEIAAPTLDQRRRRRPDAGAQLGDHRRTHPRRAARAHPQREPYLLQPGTRGVRGGAGAVSESASDAPAGVA